MAETREQMAARLEMLLDEGDDVFSPLETAALRAGVAALRAQGEDDAEWWRQVAQGLSVEIAKLQSERPRCEWRPFPGGPQCFRHAGHGLPHQTRSDESEASMTCACGAPTNLGSGDGEFRCWKCHCAWLSSQESVGSCSIVPSSSPGSGCEGQQGTGGSGSSEVSWREAVEAGWDDGVRFASEVLRSQVFPRESARAACVDRVLDALRLPSPPEAVDQPDPHTLRDAALVHLHATVKALVAENVYEANGELHCRSCLPSFTPGSDLHAPDCLILKLTQALGTYTPRAEVLS